MRSTFFRLTLVGKNSVSIRFAFAATLVLTFATVAFGDAPRLVSYISSRAGNTDWANPESPYSHYVLAFLVDDANNPFQFRTAGGWTDGTLHFNQSSQIVDRIHTAGKRVMLGFGGGTMASQHYRNYAGREADLAEALADVVKDNGLDGIDIDWEDTAGFTMPRQVGYNARDFLIKLTTELRDRLPQGQYEISHAPQPPYLTASGGTAITGYNDVLRSVGDEIDFLNMQYYNNAGYQTPTEVVAHYTSVVDAGLITSRQLLVGKPVEETNAGQGFIPVDDITSQIVAPLVQEYGDQFGGVFNWEFKSDTNPDFYWGNSVAESLVVPEPAQLPSHLVTLVLTGIAFRRKKQSAPVWFWSRSFVLPDATRPDLSTTS